MKQFQTYRNVERTVQRTPIYLPPEIQFSSVNCPYLSFTAKGSVWDHVPHPGVMSCLLHCGTDFSLSSSFMFFTVLKIQSSHFVECLLIWVCARGFLDLAPSDLWELNMYISSQCCLQRCQLIFEIGHGRIIYTMGIRERYKQELFTPG